MTKNLLRALALPAALTLAAAAANAQSLPVTLYQQNFEGTFPRAEWSNNTIINADHTNRFTRFNGRYSNGWTQLTLAGPPPLFQDRSNGSPDGGGGQPGGPGNPPSPPNPPQPRFYQFVLNFDLFILDSWDASESVYGDDRIVVTANSNAIFSETFANQPGVIQSFRAPDVGPTQLGFNGHYRDSIYRNISIPFTVDDPSQLRIRFADNGLQGLLDESWGIDNVSVTYTVVPAPAAAALAGVAGLGAFARRRRPN